MDDRNEGWAKHIFREHNKAAYVWADKGMNGEHVLRETREKSRRRAVERVCGLWNGSYKEGRWEVRLWICPKLKNEGRWETVLTECVPVSGRSAMDAEAIGCGRLIARMRGLLNGLKPL